MILLLTPAQRRAMAISAQREQAETSLDWNPREGQRNVTQIFKVLEISVRVAFLNFPLVQ